MLQRSPQRMLSALDTLRVRLEAVRYATRDINIYEFRDAEGLSLPQAAPGAHIDVHLPNLGVRQYSLITGQDDDAYVVAVKREAGGTGGSIYLHDHARVGMCFDISAPRNHFPLREEATCSVLIAGGIGVTPICSMVHRLNELGASWRLYFAARSPDDAAFARQLERYPQVTFHFDCDHGGQPMDLDEIASLAPADADFYCCGPAPMLAAFERAFGDRPAERKHVEYFAPKQEAASGGFRVCVKSTGQILDVPQGKSVLDVLLEAGIAVPYSCADGICGACETGVIDGIPDHRDSVLTEDERAGNKSMMVCCSGSQSGLLTLDL